MPPGSEHVRLLHRAREQQQQGNLAGACKQLRKAIKFNPADSRAYHLLAQIQQQMGQASDSAQTYKTCLRQNPKDLDSLINLGILQKRSGQVEAAISNYRKALSIRGDIPELHNNLGNAWLDQGHYNEAATAYRKATQLKPDFAGAWHNLGRCYLQQGQPAEALEPLRHARQLQPTWQILSDLADCLSLLPLDQADPQLDDDLLACLGLHRIDARKLSRAACRYLRLHQFPDLLEQQQIGELVPDQSTLKRLEHPVMLAILQREPLCDWPLENLLRTVRRQLLLVPDMTGDSTGLVAAMAEQCFLNEYLWETSPEEQERVTQLEYALEASLTTGESIDFSQLLLYACYRSLASLIPDRQQTENLMTHSNEKISRLVRQQILEPADESAYRHQLPILTAIHNETSQAVRSQYEDNPYPRWRMIDEPESCTLGEYLCKLFPYLRRQPPAFANKPEILCAGCGTGLQALRMARRIESANILAVDISRTSLAYGQRQARQHNCHAVRFAQGDILQLDDSIGPFDCIECYGVLHHLADPEAGWRSLRQLLKSGGVMRIGLYSHAARGPIRQIRQYISEQQLAADIDGIREVRRHIAASPASDPVHGLIHSPDFYTVSECRDLMFHVQEHQLDLGHIAAILNRLELEFLGFELEDFILLKHYREEFPDDPDGLNLENWQQFERSYPDSFASQYIFWVQAKR